MKKCKIARGIIAFALVVIMMFGTTMSAFAAESNEVERNAEVTTTYGNNLSALVSNLESGKGGSAIAHLDSYVGITKKFTVTLLASVGNSGTVSIYIKRVSDGSVVGSWGLSSGKTTDSTTFTLPKSGDYKMVVYNGTNGTTSVLGYWE